MAPGLLPELPNPQSREMPPGPTPWSNWVIPGRVLAGAYPASLDDVETEQLLSLLLELGVSTFVCLQAEVNIHIPEHSWRAGVGLRPYIRDAQRLLSRAQEAGSTAIPQRKIDFLHLPIIDGSVTTDSAMSRLADDCCGRVLRGETMYIHCWGGHGRTGTLVAVMLGRLYDLPAAGALRLTQAYHDTRVYPQGVRSPQTTVQRAQVKRLLLMPNAFAGICTTAGGAVSSSKVPQQQQQQQQQAGSPVSHSGKPQLAFSRATSAKQSVSPISRLSSKTLAAAAAVGSLSLSAGLGSSSRSSSSTQGAFTAAHNISLSQTFTRSAAAAAPAAPAPANISTNSSSSYHARLLQHQQTAPSAVASAVSKLTGSLNGSSSSSSSSRAATAGSGGGNGGSSSGSRQGWPVGGAVAAAGLAASSSSSSSSSRVPAATSPLLRSDVLRTPMQSRLVQPVSHRG